VVHNDGGFVVIIDLARLSSHTGPALAGVAATSKAASENGRRSGACGDKVSL